MALGDIKTKVKLAAEKAGDSAIEKLKEAKARVESKHHKAQAEAKEAEADAHKELAA
jgi:hypothetical protein